MSSLTVQFYLEGSGELHEDAPLFDFSRQYLSGAYVFTVDGIPVNADVDEYTGKTAWMQEDLSMSLQLLENMTAWVEGKSKGAGCFYDYVVFSLLELENDQVELLSYYEGSPESRHNAHCNKIELFLGFDGATQQWEAYYARLWQKLDSGNQKNAFSNLSTNVQHQLDPGIWIMALAQWHKAITEFKNRL
jgi:hypothetical protein